MTLKGVTRSCRGVEPATAEASPRMLTVCVTFSATLGTREFQLARSSRGVARLNLRSCRAGAHQQPGPRGEFTPIRLHMLIGNRPTTLNRVLGQLTQSKHGCPQPSRRLYPARTCVSPSSPGKWFGQAPEITRAHIPAQPASRTAGIPQSRAVNGSQNVRDIQMALVTDRAGRHGVPYELGGSTVTTNIPGFLTRGSAAVPLAERDRPSPSILRRHEGQLIAHGRAG